MAPIFPMFNPRPAPTGEATALPAWTATTIRIADLTSCRPAQAAHDEGVEPSQGEGCRIGRHLAVEDVGLVEQQLGQVRDVGSRSSLSAADTALTIHAAC